MEYVKTIILSFCVASVFIGILYTITPDGNISKSVKYLLSLAFLVTVISVGKADNTGVEFPEFQVSQSEVDSLLVENARLTYSEALKKSNINFSSITVFTNKDENGDIKIIRVEIETKESAEVVKQALGEVSAAAEVIIINE